MLVDVLLCRRQRKWDSDELVAHTLCPTIEKNWTWVVICLRIMDDLNVDMMNGLLGFIILSEYFGLGWLEDEGSGDDGA